MSHMSSFQSFNLVCYLSADDIRIAPMDAAQHQLPFVVAANTTLLIASGAASCEHILNNTQCVQAFGVIGSPLDGYTGAPKSPPGCRRW